MVWSDCQYCAFKRAWHLSRESGPTISFLICALHFIHSGLMSCSCNLICTDSPPCDIWASFKTANRDRNLEMKGLATALAWIWPLNRLSVTHFYLFLSICMALFSVHAQMHLSCIAKNIICIFLLGTFGVPCKAPCWQISIWKPFQHRFGSESRRTPWNVVLFREHSWVALRIAVRLYTHPRIVIQVCPLLASRTWTSS